ncbi:MAG: transcriptional regulator, partial [Elusimicrobiaceae bacterium]|nr:transcriptional regulator [Elusimicrobiaceae bacterium]
MLNETLSKISRLMYILNEFDKGEVFLPSIAEDLGVTLRTVQRDIRILENAGFPFANTKKGAYCFVEGFSLQRMRLNAKEAAMLALMGDIAHSLGGGFAETYKELRNKVVESRNNPFFIKIAKGQAFKDPKLLKTLEQAINEQRHVEIGYENSPLSGRAISPLKIAWFNGFWYLLAYGKDELILKLRLDKIKSAKLLDTHFSRPQKLEKILRDSASIWFEENRKIKATLTVDGEVAQYFKKREYFPKQKIVKTAKDGTLTVECAIGRYEEILPTILEWIPHIVV